MRGDCAPELLLRGADRIGFLGGRVCLEDPKNVAFRVAAVGEVALAGNGVLFGHHGATRVLHGLRTLFPVVDTDGVDDRLFRIVARHDRAVDPYIVFGTGSGQQIFERPTPILELPAERLAVEVGRPFRIIGRDFEVR